MENDLKEVIVDLIDQLEEAESEGPIVYRWKYDDYPEYVVALGVKKDVYDNTSTETH